MKTTYDRDANALYIYVAKDASVARSEQIDAGTLVDLDRFGNLVGIEILNPSRRWPVDELVRRYGLEQSIAGQLRKLVGLKSRAFPDPQARTLVGS